MHTLPTEFTKLTAMAYCSFTRWEDADKVPRTVLKVSDSRYYGAPQVFYFAPHRKWYLIYQMGVPGAKMMWVAYSTTTNIAAPNSWTQAQPILDGGAKDPRKEGGLDYWIICDDQRAYLFFTSLNGKLWRMWTKLEEFPMGFDHCEVALQGPFFEASHTYRLKGSGKYLTMNLRFVFQGMLEQEKASKGYGQFLWRIGILSPVNDPDAKK
jgi:hypothetical protein